MLALSQHRSASGRAGSSKCQVFEQTMSAVSFKYTGYELWLVGDYLMMTSQFGAWNRRL